MKKWTENNKEDLHFDQIELIPDIDYTISIKFNNNVVEGVVNCKCGVRIKLRTRNDKLQITNFYKHLRTPSCSMMREKKRQYDEQNQSPIYINSNDKNKNMNDNRRTASQQPLSEITTNALTSQRHRADIISLSTTNNPKRNSSNLRAASSQQSSTKRHKR